MKHMVKRMTAVAASAALACTGFVGCSKQTEPIGLEDYVKLTAEGYELLGKLDFEVDVEELVSDHYEDFGFGKYNDKAKAFAKELEKTLEKGTLSTTRSLLNGDAVTLTWDEQAVAVLEEEYGFDLVTDPLMLTVEGFDALGRVDPFEQDVVYFSGVDGYGRAHADGYDISTMTSEGWYTYLDIRYDISLKGADDADASDSETTELTGLKNGDVVIAKVSRFGKTGEALQRDLAENYQLIFTATEKEYTVSDLEPAIYVDYFEGVTVAADTNTVAPFGSAIVDTSNAVTFNNSYCNPTYGALSFSASGGGSLKNGDTVTVTLMYGSVPLEDVLDEFAAATGYTTDVFSKEYIVNGFNTRVTTLEELDQSVIDTATDTFIANRQNEFDGYSDKTFVDAAYIGSYLVCTYSETAWRPCSNSWYACYEVTATDQNGDQVTYYSFINYTYVEYDVNGTFDLAEKSFTEPKASTWFFDHQSIVINDTWFIGFETKEDLKGYIESLYESSATHACDF